MSDEHQAPRSAPIPLTLGGPLQPEHVLGRDELIQSYWSRLETQSLALIGPRRIGKSSIVRRMAAYPAQGFLVCGLDLLTSRGLDDLAMALHRSISTLFGQVEREVPSRDDFLDAVFDLQWSKFGTRLLAELDDYARGEQKTAVLLIEGLSSFINNVLQRGEQDAVELLNLLRSARENFSNLRMLIVAASEFGDVLRRLGDASGSAIGDVVVEIVPPLDEASGRLVVRALAADFADTVVDAIVSLSEGHPLLIQLLVAAQMKRDRSEAWTVEEDLRGLIESPGDPLALRQELGRIEDEFGIEDAEFIREILDALALQPGQTLAELLTALPDAPTRTELSNLLRRLIDGFYIVREGSQHRFRQGFQRLFWLAERGLQVEHRSTSAPSPARGPATIVAPEPADTRYLRRLRVTNLKLISDLTLEFETEDGSPRMWTCLLGDNGCGKTSLLQAIVLGALGDKLLSGLIDDAHAYVDARHRDQTTSISTEFSAGVSTRLEITPGNYQWVGVGEHHAWLEVLRRQRTPGFFVAGYGVGRRLARPGEVAVAANPISDRVRGLFDVHHKTLGVEFGEALDGIGLRDAYVETMAKLIASAGLDDGALLPGVSGLSRSATKDLVVSFDPGDGAFELAPASLSAGYQSLLTWLGELVGQVMLEARAPVEPADMQGIVLIDEIDLHLHPTWQRRVVPILRAVFPRLQFIVTTHSPLVLTGFAASEVIALTIEDGVVVRRDDVPDLTGYSAHDVLEEEALFDTDAFGPAARSGSAT